MHYLNIAALYGQGKGLQDLESSRVEISSVLAPVATALPDKEMTRVCACMHAVSLVMSNSLQFYGLKPARLLCPQDSPGIHCQDRRRMTCCWDITNTFFFFLIPLTLKKQYYACHIHLKRPPENICNASLWIFKLLWDWSLLRVHDMTQKPVLSESKAFTT